MKKLSPDKRAGHDDDGESESLESDTLHHREGVYGLVWELGFFLRKWWVVLSMSAAAMISTFYYNILSTFYANAQTEASSVVVYGQMRKDVSANVEKAVGAYVRHEKEIYKYVVEVRAMMVGAGVKPEGNTEGKPESKIDKKTSELMGKFFGLAEQYPDLKFSAEFHFLVSAILEVEKELAAARVRYNNSANVYGTALTTIPGNFFAFIFRFKPLPLYEADKGGVDFKVMDFGPN
ncbi:LemA family protein [Bdellovibrionota bacterium FG-1]